MIDIESLTRAHIRKVKPYSSARDEFQGTASIYLDANENPYNSDYNRYPDPHQVQLKRQIARLKGVEPNQIFIGNGSDEIIDLLIRVFCEPGRDKVIIPLPTYGMYSVSAEVNNVAIDYINLNSDFSLDAALVKKSFDKAKLLFLCSPNNPTGNIISKQVIVELLDSFQGLIILDEAYIDFSENDGFLSSLSKYKNLFIIQTLSKAWGLAGLRLGMGFGHPEIIQLLNRIKPPYNINTVTQHIAMSSLSDELRKNKLTQEIIKEREKLANDLKKLKCVETVYPSVANFLLVKVNDAKKVYNFLLGKQIVVRDRSDVNLCENCLRITVGTSEENKKLIAALLEV